MITNKPIKFHLRQISSPSTSAVDQLFYHLTVIPTQSVRVSLLAHGLLAELVFPCCLSHILDYG